MKMQHQSESEQGSIMDHPWNKTGWFQTERFGPTPRTGPGPAKFRRPGPNQIRNEQNFQISDMTSGGPWIPESELKSSVQLIDCDNLTDRS